NPAEFAGTAVALANDIDRRRQLGAAGRSRVEERYGWEAIGARMNAFYRQLASGGTT
ncbi:hypothetical protein HOK31_23060, partial [Candidatus Poribacteria bacterium]|nr:hypothetical protein [Candidatus Poribacteria bacterium]